MSCGVVYTTIVGVVQPSGSWNAAPRQDRLLYSASQDTNQRDKLLYFLLKHTTCLCILLTNYNTIQPNIVASSSQGEFGVRHIYLYTTKCSDYFMSSLYIVQCI